MNSLVPFSEIVSDPILPKPLSQSKKVEVTGSGIKPLSLSLAKKWKINHDILVEGSEPDITNTWNDFYISKFSKDVEAYYIQEVEDQSMATSSMDWYIFLKKNHTKELTINEMTYIIDGIHDLVRNNRHTLVDDILKHTLTSQSSAESILALLRSTFFCRELLSSWRNLLNLSKSWLKERGLQPESILIGLM